MQNSGQRAGTSFMDLIISIGIIALLFGGIYLVYFSIVSAVGNINVRTAATMAISQELETIRNLPYSSVGTTNGVPVGVIPQVQTMTINNHTFTLTTTIRNIDDPFDGTVASGTDAAPADYKSVTVDATCPLCNNSLDVAITTTVAPQSLESVNQNGTLSLFAVDANGNPVSDALVHVVNASVTPSIDLVDTTNASGILELVGVPSSTQRYAVTVTKSGYSSDATYLPGAPSNPNPIKPHLTVTPQTVTAGTFVIDQLSQLNVYSSDNQCVAVGNTPFSITGAKLIGTSPNVLKYSSSSITNGSGLAALQNLEWDSYVFALTSSSQNLVGTLPLAPLVLNPSSTASFRFVVQPAANPALLVTIEDAATGAGLSNATATLTQAGFSESQITGHATLSQTDWSGSGKAGYATQTGGIDTASLPGAITLATNGSGNYPTGTIESLTSNTFDVGGSSSTFYGITWNPSAQPPQAGANSLEIQVAANNDNASWNFVGPDGTSGTYFTTPGALPAALGGNRYFRYKVYMTTQDPANAPELDDIFFDFSANCVPQAQTLFTSLAPGNYVLDVTAPSYREATTSVSIGSGFQSSTVSLTAL